MSDFWKLWNAAKKGDTEAAHQVNVLVYQQLIHSGGTLIDGHHRVNAKIYPDYMSDLNAAAGLVLPENCYISITTPVAPRTTYDVRAFMIDEYDVGRGIAIAHSTRLSSAWVAVWLQVATGKIAG